MIKEIILATTLALTTTTSASTIQRTPENQVTIPYSMPIPEKPNKRDPTSNMKAISEPEYKIYKEKHFKHN